MGDMVEQLGTILQIRVDIAGTAILFFVIAFWIIRVLTRMNHLFFYGGVNRIMPMTKEQKLKPKEKVEDPHPYVDVVQN